MELRTIFVASVFYIFFNVELAGCQQVTGEDRTTPLRLHGIVPTVIDNVPPQVLQVKFHESKVNLGNVLTQSETDRKPTFVSWDNVDPKKFYTLLMTDPDPPIRQFPILREICHWLVVNAPGNETNAGEVISEYLPPGPPPLTGLHRFVLLLFEQQGRTVFKSAGGYRLPGNSSFSRFWFNTRKFAKEFSLREPIAANFYQTRYGKY